jgi:capsular polysaccharide transport system ATP-binding protein
MINFENVTKFFDVGNGKKKFVLKNVTLNLPEKSNIGIIGKSNAGKSTIIKLINGAVFPNQGKVVTNEKISWPVGIKNFIKAELSARQNTYIVAKLLCVEDKLAKEKINEVKNVSELAEDFENEVKNYSNTMKNRLAMAISLVFDFDTYLIDDANIVRDVNFNDKFEMLFQKTKKNGSRIIFTTNYPKNLIGFCDYFYVIKNYNLFEFKNYNQAENFYLAN